MTEAQPADTERLLTSKDVMARLRLSRDVVARLRRTGELKSFKVGGSVRFHEDDVRAYIDSLRGVGTRDSA